MQCPIGSRIRERGRALAPRGPTAARGHEMHCGHGHRFVSVALQHTVGAQTFGCPTGKVIKLPKRCPTPALRCPSDAGRLEKGYANGSSVTPRLALIARTRWSR